MTPRTFNTPIKIAPNAIVTSLYSNRQYTGEDFNGIYFAVKENGHYVFRSDGSGFKVSPEYVTIEQLN